MIAASTAVFDGIAERYDEIFTESVIGRAQRQAVWRELERMLAPGQRVLEINCGTGVDAMCMAELGVEVDACDISPRMIDVAKRRQEQQPPRAAVTFFVQAIERLEQLGGFYDGVLSNFGGLNCVSDLGAAARQLARMVRPGGFLVMCLAGRFCAWEVAWYAMHGEISKATRRLGGEADGRVNEATLRVYYRTVAELTRAFAPAFRVVRRRGIGVLVPPTCAENWARQYPGAMGVAAGVDRVLSRVPLVRAVSDHVLLVTERTRS
jgi:ubiquinone/menaquinone biosynthesis C-methylase UbiE